MASPVVVDCSSSEDLISEDWSGDEADSDSDAGVILEKDVEANTREQEKVVDIPCLDNLNPESEQFPSSIPTHQIGTDDDDGRKNRGDTDYSEVNSDADDEDSDCSDGNLGNINTVVFCGQMAAQQRYRGAVQAGKIVRTAQKVASWYVGSSLSHTNNNPVLAPKTPAPKPLKPLSTVSVSLKEDLEMSSDEEEADDDAISNEESARYVKRKYEDDTKSVKKTRKQSVVKGNPGREKYSMFWTADGVDQSGRGKTKNRRVKCLLCNNDKIISSGNFGRHFTINHLLNN